MRFPGVGTCGQLGVRAPPAARPVCPAWMTTNGAVPSDHIDNRHQQSTRIALVATGQRVAFVHGWWLVSGSWLVSGCGGHPVSGTRAPSGIRGRGTERVRVTAPESDPCAWPPGACGLAGSTCGRRYAAPGPASRTNSAPRPRPTPGATTWRPGLAPRPGSMTGPNGPARRPGTTTSASTPVRRSARLPARRHPAWRTRLTWTSSRVRSTSCWS